MIFNVLKKCAFRHSLKKASRLQYSTNTSKEISDLGILGVPFSKGQTKDGVENTPNVLRENGLIDVLNAASNESLRIKDYGNLEYTAEDDSVYSIPNMKNPGELFGCSKALIKKVRDILQENDQILTIGGDHAIGFGSVAGHLLHNPNLALIWIDAHADVNIPSISLSGNTHGMPVSMLLNRLRHFWKAAKLEDIAPNCLSPDQLVYIGLRSVDPYEAYVMQSFGIKAYAMDSIDKLGINKVIEMTLDAIKPDQKLHISFDIDSLDARVAPSTGTAVEGGLTLREGVTILEALRETKRIEAFDLTEINLDLGSKDDAKHTLSSSLEILKAAYGHKRAGNVQGIEKEVFHECEVLYSEEYTNEIQSK